jgi:hypothetical protein
VQHCLVGSEMCIRDRGSAALAELVQQRLVDTATAAG